MSTNKTRHGKTSLTKIKLSCPVDLDTWRRVNKAAESEGKGIAQWLRALIMETVWQIPLSAEDYEIIQNMRENRQERS